MICNDCHIGEMKEGQYAVDIEEAFVLTGSTVVLSFSQPGHKPDEHERSITSDIYWCTYCGDFIPR